MVLRFFFVFCICLPCLSAWSRPPASSSFTPPVRTKTQKFFDFDRDGFLSQYEQGCLNSYAEFHWPLANTKRKLKFDDNGNRLLEPTEWQAYQADRKNKTTTRTNTPLKK